MTGTPAYLIATGAHLPGPPRAAADMPRLLGVIDDESERFGRLVLRQNGIKARHYALGEDGRPTDTNAGMAAAAVKAACEAAGIEPGALDLLAAATTQGDLLVPGHASMVHGALGGGPVEIASFQSVCASVMMATRMGIMAVRAGEARRVGVVGSEFSSRWFRPGFYEGAKDKLSDRSARMSAEFLRWTLSDGAGAALIADAPSPHAPAFKVVWSRLVSLGDRFDACMIAGQAPDRRDSLRDSWSFYPGGPAEAAREGAVMLYQDMPLLKRIIRAWIGEYLKLVDEGLVVPAKVDWFLCHYSARSLREEIGRLMRATGGMIDEERWYTNLYERGNTGAAAIYVMLDEFMRSGRAKPGDQILCLVPESGRATVGFMMLEAV